ncbi:MAG: Bug family tripartite tricarboxylate transporter substrate binding protein [Xanthobacteraceae bacterium]
MITRILARAVIAMAFSLTTGSAARADAVSDFFHGNTIRLYVSANAGGGYDHVARIFVKYFPNHMPGNPKVIVLNMPGAAGVTMTNWAYSVAPKDGLMLGMANLTMPMNQVIMPAQVRYDATKLNWIGNLEESTGSIFTYHTSRTKTFEDALKRETVMGVSSRASILYQLLTLSNRMLNTKFKIILGYSANRVISIERGEIEGSASNLENFAGIAPHWLKNDLINVLIVNAPKRVAKYPDVPTMIEKTDNPGHKQMLEFMMLQSATSRAIFAPPGVPPERVEALRRAFDKTARDPGFVAEMEKALFELDPSTGERTHEAVARLVATSPDIAAKLLQMIK